MNYKRVCGRGLRESTLSEGTAGLHGSIVNESVVKQGFCKSSVSESTAEGM